MQYVSQQELDAFAKGKRNEATGVLRTTAVSHEREVEKRGFVYLWIEVLVVVVVCVALWIVGHYHALRLLYPKEVEWFKDRYTLGPRPKGDDHVSLDCLLVCAEYPAFASTFLSSCRSLPQTSAIFLLIMLQQYGDEMEGIHYSGSGAQLGGHRLAHYLKGFAQWNVPDNQWRFLFKTASMYARSVAVQKAQSTPNGDTMLKALFHGGLCAVARQFYEASVDAPTMCEELLGEQAVYYQSCGATRLATAVQQGTNVGTLAGPLMHRGGKAIAKGIAKRSVQKGGKRLADYTLQKGGKRAANFVAKKAAAVVAKTAAGEVAAAADEEASGVVCASVLWIPIVGEAICAVMEAQAALAVAIDIGMTVAMTAASIGGFYAAGACPFDEYYTLVMQPGGGYKKVAWNGDKAALPHRAKAE